jgi:hypothetical protein
MTDRCEELAHRILRRHEDGFYCFNDFANLCEELRQFEQEIRDKAHKDIRARGCCKGTAKSYCYYWAEDIDAVLLKGGNVP